MAAPPILLHAGLFLTIAAGAALSGMNYTDTVSIALLLTGAGHFSGLISAAQNQLSRAKTSDENQALKGLLEQFADENHPLRRRGFTKRLATVTVLDPVLRSSTTYKVLAEKEPLRWTDVGPVLNGFVLRVEDRRIWNVALPFTGVKITISLTGVDRDDRDVSLDLSAGETLVRHTRAAPQPQPTYKADQEYAWKPYYEAKAGPEVKSERQAKEDATKTSNDEPKDTYHQAPKTEPGPQTTGNPFLDLANQIIAEHTDCDRQGLSRLRHKVAKAIHPDHGQPGEVAARTEALAAANARIDRMMPKVNVNA